MGGRQAGMYGGLGLAAALLVGLFLTTGSS
jgi:hypothetical protein